MFIFYLERFSSNLNLRSFAIDSYFQTWLNFLFFFWSAAIRCSARLSWPSPFWSISLLKMFFSIRPTLNPAFLFSIHFTKTDVLVLNSRFGWFIYASIVCVEFAFFFPFDHLIPTFSFFWPTIVVCVVDPCRHSKLFDCMCSVPLPVLFRTSFRPLSTKLYHFYSHFKPELDMTLLCSFFIHLHVINVFQF